MKADVRKYALLIVLQSILYGIMDVASKLAYQSVNVYFFLFVRYILASLLMLCLWHRQIFKELKSVPLRKYFVSGICMSLAFVCSNMALRFTAATNMSFIRSLSSLIVPFLSLVFFKQNYSKKEPFLQAFMLLGLYLLCAKGGLHHFGFGEVLALIAATLVASSLVFGKSALSYVSAKTLSFVQSVFSIVFCALMVVITRGYAGTESMLQPKILFVLLYAAFGCTIGGYMLQNIALLHLSAKQVGIFQCLYPISTALIASLVLNEKLSFPGIVGALIISVCVILENLLPES